LSQRDIAYQPRATPWEQRQAHPRVLKERCILPDQPPVPELCGVPSERIHIHPIPRVSPWAGMRGSVGAIINSGSLSFPVVGDVRKTKLPELRLMPPFWRPLAEKWPIPRAVCKRCKPAPRSLVPSVVLRHLRSRRSFLKSDPVVS
jgi:hypothetical protein